MEGENQKAIDNALFKKLEEITIKMNSDPILYKGDVENYLAMFKIEFEKVQGDTMKKNQRFGELLIFLARAVKHFPQLLGWVPGAVMKLMEELGPTLNPYLRKKCVGSIMILRAKSILLPVSTIEFLLTQMRLQDKQLRSMIYKYVVNDIRRMNSHHQNNKINQQLRAFISGYIPKHNDKTAQKSLRLMIELYKRNVWTDTRSVNIIAESCFAPSAKIRLMACHFLMETTMPLEELPDSDDEPVNPSDIRAKKGIVRQTKAKEKQLQKEKRKAARRLRKKEIESRNKNFMPIDLIYNPQNFVEKLFNIMSGKSQKYNHKLIYMGLIGRVIWRHRLILLPFYRSLIKYLEPKQKDVSLVLTALAESIHQIVPDDEIEALVKHIIEHFVNDRCSEFTMTIGLNTLREIFKKMPSIISEEIMLYLCTYYEYKNKNVSKAAKSVINLVRELNNMLLPKKFRGHDRGDAENDQNANNGPSYRIPGVQLLPNEGSLPIEMDRVLTDEDFKKIRKLMKKKEEQQQQGNVVDNQIEYSEEEQQEGDDDDENQEDDGQGQEQEGQDEEMQLESGSDEQIQDEDMQHQVEQQENQDGQQEDEESQEQSVIDWDDAEEIQFQDQVEEQEQSKLKNNKTKKIAKQPKDIKSHPSKKVQQQESEDEDQESEQYEQIQDGEPHGFISTNQIAYYKMSKTELKAQKKEVKEGKEKFKHKPKEKKGGTNNREKQHLKPIMMIRAKKNKIRSNQKQLKLKIKNLKNQLGKVRSGKEAKKLKNKVIHKKK